MCCARKAMHASMLTQTYAIQLSRVGDGVMVDQKENDPKFQKYA